MSKIRKLPAQQARVETGPVQFGDDWPGVFIRGDNAGYYAMALDALLQQSDKADVLTLSILNGLRDARAVAKAEREIDEHYGGRHQRKAP